jgi:hypothetical protein
MKRWLIAIAIFVGCEIILLLTGVGLWALVHDKVSAILLLVLPGALAVWVSGKIENRKALTAK